MNKTARYFFQIFIWLGIWVMLWFYGGLHLRFIEENLLGFLFQVTLLFIFIYYAVPKLLFKKKLLLFFIVSVSVVIVGAYLSSILGLGPRPHIGKPPLRDMLEGNPRTPPSRFFIQLLILSISSAIAVLIETFIDAKQKEKSIALAKAELIESELKFLKMQINPHFLFNALNNIYALSVTNSSKTQESINTLSEMLRYVIYDCEQPKVPLRKELDYITNYIELFKLKNSKPFDISFTETIENDHSLVAPMLFVPFIENAFKHSGIEKRKEYYVHISLLQKGNSIEFTVKNSIPTITIATDAQGGIGLPNVQKRLEILYPEKHNLKITRTTNFKVYLKLEI